MDNVINEYRTLDKKNNQRDLTKPEKAAFTKLKRQLARLPESDPLSLLIEIENATYAMKKSTEEEGH